METSGVKVLHINQWDSRGGSARASMRIHNTMLRHGVDSHLMVSRYTGSLVDRRTDVSLLAGESQVRWSDGLSAKVMHALSVEDLFYPSTTLLPYRVRFREADIVQLYSMHGGYFAFTALPALSRIKPVFWRLSDAWPFTGHCTYPAGCQRWLTGCGACPVFQEYPYGLWRDTTASSWRHKKRYYERTRLTFVAPSRWMYELARQSPLISRFPILHIPNGVETGIFQPLDMGFARRLWNLPPTDKILLASTSLYGDPRKGGRLADDLFERIRAIAARDARLHVLFVGRRNKPFEERLGRILPFTATGYVESKRLLATLYCAADLVLHPALDENLANSVMEGMACGTPVACFDVGGMRDVVRDGETGILAPRGDVEALARGVVSWLFAGAEDIARRRSACTKLIRTRFSAGEEARLLLRAYERALRGEDLRN